MESALHPPTPRSASAEEKRAAYARVLESLERLLEGEDDPIAAMATVVCELHHGFESFDWTGFYRHVADQWLVIGPYQGTHGCLRIPFSSGVCGRAARSRTTQLVPDVSAVDDHIACSASSRSEIVVPVLAGARLVAVLDVDSNTLAAFDEVDREGLERVVARLAPLLAGGADPLVASTPTDTRRG